MFQEKRALFIYCVSPVHMGAGTALGVIDNPIQRERHTDYPIIIGSGLKGALRHGLGWTNKENIKAVFGPDTTESSEQAGAVSFGDAQLVAFPVRSPKRAFVYATSPTALARAARLLNIADINTEWKIEKISERECWIANDHLQSKDKVALESFEFEANINDDLKKIAEWLSDNALPKDAAYQFFRDKLRDDLVLLSDEDFGYFVRNATVVEPHVRIEDATGTAQDGGLFYTENLPPESLLLAPVMASKERKDGGLKADQVMGLLAGNENQAGIDGRQFQIGGDATTGRGQVILNLVKGGQNA
ncbi:MAG: type III-B CRISPR module RAMP protein Cmr4 [Deltaproteobacteria bacterium]|nr:type III-B CRISPR module RAMP protein Cmr4 [Deltaproteobacteria bacterium]